MVGCGYNWVSLALKVLARSYDAGTQIQSISSMMLANLSGSRAGSSGRSIYPVVVGRAAFSV